MENRCVRRYSIFAVCAMRGCFRNRRGAFDAAWLRTADKRLMHDNGGACHTAPRYLPDIFIEAFADVASDDPPQANYAIPPMFCAGALSRA